MNITDGLYDRLVTESLLQGLSNLGGQSCPLLAELSVSETAERLGDAVGKQLVGLLDEIAGEGNEKARQQLAMVNAILAHVRKQAGAASEMIEGFVEPPKVLKAVHLAGQPPAVPETGLAIPWLFTAGKGSPSLLTELRRELNCCDQVDVLVSFITISGVRKLLDILQTATAVDANGVPRTRLRILTTTYTGATEIEALDALSRLPGCEVKVSLDGRRTRLHAKAWIFRRKTGFGSAYVGSANMSGAALLGGLEWTVKFTEQGQANLYERAIAHFETLWNDSEFQRYDPLNTDHRTELSRALKRESGEQLPATTTFFDLVPKDYQKDMLEQLLLEREQGRCRNLVVAATGTGKTVVAAFDYRATCERNGGRPRLLFVAHREEILKQALRTFREVLRDHSFGELFSGAREAESHEHLFATIDIVAARDLVAQLQADYWHTVIVDECHRLAADRFYEFVTAVRPQILLGLTATPERSDGKPIFPYFHNRPDGSPAVELRLWHALELQLLCPFEYYACDDETDFSEVCWDKPGERESIDKLVTGNDVRARLIVNEWARLTGNPRQGKALVFCVSVAHAQFMTEQFNKAGYPSLCVIGDTDPEMRRAAPEKLQRGEVCALVTCDLYNEGVDLPSVDTVLLLRPTQSPVLFQQQIGRGLRLHEGKDSCLVLDFVGRHRAEFRFDRIFSSITGLSRNQLVEAVERGFSSLPPGCHIQLQRIAREQVLQSLRTVVNQTWRRLRGELQAYVGLRGRTDVKLIDFLREQGLEPEELYRSHGRSGWTSLKRDAGLIVTQPIAEEDYFGRRLGDLLHCNDPEQLALLVRLGEQPVPYRIATDRERLRLQMLAYQIDAQRCGSGDEFLARVCKSDDLRSELGELGIVLQARQGVRLCPIPGLEDVPLNLHASYGIREILSAVKWLTPERRTPFQAGVLALPERKTELLFVTLDKSEGFHERISYRDYAISTERFHWQTQNTAAPETKAGQRYIGSPGNGWSFQLFVRHVKGEPYRACGPVVLEKYEGSRPMSITWKLCFPLTTRLFQEFSVLRGA